MIKLKKNSVQTSRKMKLYADLLLTFSICATAIVMGLPITDHLKLWINAAISMVSMGGKLLTNVVDFKAEEEKILEADDNSDQK